jgi:hypothetical protein
MKDYILDVLLFILQIFISVLTLPAILTIIALFIAACVMVSIAGILLSPIGLLCLLKDYIEERKR